MAGSPSTTSEKPPVEKLGGPTSDQDVGAEKDVEGSPLSKKIYICFAGSLKESPQDEMLAAAKLISVGAATIALAVGMCHGLVNPDTKPNDPITADQVVDIQHSESSQHAPHGESDALHGWNCKFNHPPRRKNQRVEERANRREENSETAGQKECKYYLTSGGCKYGKDCKFSHGSNNSSTSSIPELNFLGLPIRPGEKECTYYMRTGSCKYVDCRFHHPDPTPVVGDDSPSGYDNGGSLPSQFVSSSSVSSWSSPRAFSETSPFLSAMFPPTQGSPTSNPEWNGYQAATYPTSERSLPTAPALAINSLPTEINFPMHYQYNMAVEEYPERPGEPECSFFLKTGDYNFKSNCKYRHPKNCISKGKANSCTLNDKGLPLRPVNWKPESPDKFGNDQELLKSVDSLELEETTKQGQGSKTAQTSSKAAASNPSIQKPAAYRPPHARAAVAIQAEVDWKPESTDKFGNDQELLKSVDSLELEETTKQGQGSKTAQASSKAAASNPTIQKPAAYRPPHAKATAAVQAEFIKVS